MGWIKCYEIVEGWLLIERGLFCWQKYMIPMKTQTVVDSCLVDEIFYKINEIYMHHATFIAFLARAMHDSCTAIGDVINKNVNILFTSSVQIRRSQTVV